MLSERGDNATNAQSAQGFDVTFFDDCYAKTCKQKTMTLDELRDLVFNTDAATKAGLPWLKLALFGEKKTESKSLRHDANVLEISGIEADYDGEVMTFDDAVACLQKAGLHALIYTSPSNTPAKPRFRVISPCSRKLPPEQRYRLVARLNGVLGGVLADESFALSQSYYYGSVNGNPDHRAEIVEGACIALRDDLDFGAIGKKEFGNDKPNGHAGHNGADNEHNGNGEAHSGGDWAQHFGKIHAGDELHNSTRDLAAELIVAGMNDGAAVNLVRGVMESSSAPHDARWRERYEDIPRLVASASEKFAEAAAATRHDGHEPFDLWNSFDPPELPTGLLPPAIENYARVQGTMMGCDPGGLAMAALTVCAAAIPDCIKLQVKRHDPRWLESARIWTALIGLPSTKKSPIIGEASRPLVKLDLAMFRAYKVKLAAYMELSREEKEGGPPPQERLCLNDTTIEAAQLVLQDSPNGVLLLRDELGGWFGAMDKYSGNKGAAADRGFWLQAFNGSSYTVNRVGRGSSIIENLSVSVLGGIQPDALRRLTSDGVEDGLLQRLFPIVLRSAEVGRDEPKPDAGVVYDVLIERLHGLTMPITLSFSTAASELRQKLEQRHLDLQRCEVINPKLGAHLGKYDGMFARLCVVWHCIEHAAEANLPYVVTEETACRVANFMQRFLMPHALAFYGGILGLSDEHDRLAALASYILAHKSAEITCRDVQSSVHDMRNLKRKDIEEDVLYPLETLGWLCRKPGPRPTSPLRWPVNPKVHERFRERGKQEADRRAKVRVIMAELGGTPDGGRMYMPSEEAAGGAPGCGDGSPDPPPLF